MFSPRGLRDGSNSAPLETLPSFLLLCNAPSPFARPPRLPHACFVSPITRRPTSRTVSFRAVRPYTATAEQDHKQTPSATAAATESTAADDFAAILAEDISCHDQSHLGDLAPAAQVQQGPVYGDDGMSEKTEQALKRQQQEGVQQLARNEFAVDGESADLSSATEAELNALDTALWNNEADWDKYVEEEISNEEFLVDDNDVGDVKPQSLRLDSMGLESNDDDFNKKVAVMFTDFEKAMDEGTGSVGLVDDDDDDDDDNDDDDDDDDVDDDVAFTRGQNQKRTKSPTAKRKPKSSSSNSDVGDVDEGDIDDLFDMGSFDFDDELDPLYHFNDGGADDDDDGANEIEQHTSRKAKKKKSRARMDKRGGGMLTPTQEEEFYMLIPPEGLEGNVEKLLTPLFELNDDMKAHEVFQRIEFDDDAPLMEEGAIDYDAVVAKERQEKERKKKEKQKDKLTGDRDVVDSSMRPSASRASTAGSMGRRRRRGRGRKPTRDKGD